MITVRILKDSISAVTGKRITTAEWTYPRFIHSEVMTHRALVKNAASSRAIPISKMIHAVAACPAVPERWGKNQKGMQANEVLTGLRCWAARMLWLKARWFAICFAWVLNKIGLHKQIANRILEPWMHMTIIITGTEWLNFFALRAHKDAQPEFQVLAFRHLDALLNSKPEVCQPGQWHLPLLEPEDFETGDLPDWVKISVARCARVSYTRHGDRKTTAEDIALHDRLKSSGHMSPFEHQAICTAGAGPSGCFTGWIPYRKQIPNENRTDVDLVELLAAKPDWITL